MAKYQIPEAYRPGFLVLAKLTPAKVSLIVDGINNSAIGDLSQDIAKKFEGKLDITAAETLNLFHTIFSFFTLSSQKDETPETLSKDLAASFQASIKDSKPEEIVQLEKSLFAILNADGKVRQTIKALRLLTDNANVYEESRIISDIRLVFEEQISTKVQGALVIHQLRISYRDLGELKNIFISMDTKDLNELKETIQRAIEKDKLISENTFTKDLSFVNYRK